MANEKTIHHTVEIVHTHKWSGLCISSFIVSLFGIIFCFIPIVNIFGLILELVALILGIAGVIYTNRNEAMQGKGLGIAGIIISCICILIVIFIDVLFVSLFAH